MAFPGDILGSKGPGGCSPKLRPSPGAAGLGTLCRTLVSASHFQPCQLWAGSRASSVHPTCTRCCLFPPGQGPGEAVPQSWLPLGKGSGPHPYLGFPGLVAAPGKSLVSTGTHLNVHPLLSLLHPDLSSISADQEVQMCSAVFECSRVQQQGVPAGWAWARLAVQHLWPKGLCPATPLCPSCLHVAGMGTHFPALALAELRAPAAKRARAMAWRCQDHPQATPAVPDGEVEGAGTHRGSCAVSATGTWMCP